MAARLPMPRPVRVFATGLIVAAVAVIGVWFTEKSGDTVTGTARAVDGDSLFVGGSEIRLYGIDAPELAQTCTRFDRVWPCGREAAEALRLMLSNRDVTCRPRDRDRYGRIVAVCQAGGVDLGAAMVKGGLAVSYGSYRADERDARDARRGIWSGSFEQPAAWRARHPRLPR